MERGHVHVSVEEASHVVDHMIAHGVGDLDLGHAGLCEHHGELFDAHAVDLFLHGSAQRLEKASFEGASGHSACGSHLTHLDRFPNVIPYEL